MIILKTMPRNLEREPREEEVEEESQKSQKEIEWENKRKEIEGWGDRLGKGIDEKVKDTVVAFNLLEIPTSSSCEGHLDHGTLAPWIEIETPDRPAERFSFRELE